MSPHTPVENPSSSGFSALGEWLDHNAIDLAWVVLTVSGLLFVSYMIRTFLPTV